MRIELIRRPERSRWMGILSPLIAIALTVVAGFIIFSAIGVNPFEALYIYFIEPLTAGWSIEDLVVKAMPIILIAVGLSLCYLSNNWNIGAEGQLVAGAIAGSVIPILFPDWHGPLVLPLMLLMGILGGMAYGAIPALLKIRFGANEILTSLMLVYVAQLFLDWLARGPWRNPEPATIFPTAGRSTTARSCRSSSATAFGSTSIFVLIAVAVAWFLLRRTITGFEISVLGQAPRAGAFAGFSQQRMILLDVPDLGRPRRSCRHLRGGRSDREAPHQRLAGLRLYRDHRRLPRPAAIRSASSSPGSSLRSPISAARGCRSRFSSPTRSPESSRGCFSSSCSPATPSSSTGCASCGPPVTQPLQAVEAKHGNA